MRVNLIPMAGEGQRFKDAGYNVPKPLIDVNGLPMVVRAANALPPADKYIFVCRKNHLEISPIETVLKRYFKDPVIIVVDELTEGQAITCTLARSYIPDDAELTIGASDNDMIYDKQIVDDLFADVSVDGWIWTFRNNKTVLQNPEMYGWVVTDEISKKAVDVSCKKTISKDPIHDHAVVGAFTFKKAKYFFDSTDNMILANARINNEFYVDIAAQFAIKMGFVIKVCEIEQYLCWGTPRDYENYQFWLQYFKKRKS